MYRRRFLASVAVAPALAGCSDILGLSCAPFDTHADRTVCYESQSDDEPVWLDVSSTVWNVNTRDNILETYDITLHNDSNGSISFNPHAGEIYLSSLNDWNKITNADRNGTVDLDSGGTYHWLLTQKPHPSPNAENTEYITANTDGPECAFLIRVSDPRTDGSLACVLVFNIEIR